MKNNPCSEEHGRCYTDKYSTREIPTTVYLCYHNPDVDHLSKIIRNNIILVVCANHSDKYNFTDNIPLTHEAHEKKVNELFAENRKKQAKKYFGPEEEFYEPEKIEKKA